jgi:radical SAM superfamily enzyme YgiQ (UPF0313 family)
MQARDLVHIHPSACATKPRFLYMPAGIFSMMNEVRSAGFDVLAVNEGLEMLLGGDMEQIIADHPASVYSIDIHWHEHLGRGLELAERIKSIHSDSTVVVGGLTASYFSEHILRIQPAVDIVVKGPGEGWLQKIIEGRKRKPVRGLVLSKPNADIDGLDHISRDWLLHREQYARCSLHGWMGGSSTFWLKTGMGCPFNCSFCGGARTSQRHIFGRADVLRRNPESVGADIVALSRQGIERVGLTQDPSFASPEYWNRLHRAVRVAVTRPGVYIEAGALPSAEYLDDFSNTFDTQRSFIALWPISPQEQVRRRHGKKYSDQLLSECLQAGERKGIRFILYFSRGVDFEEEASLDRRQDSINQWQHAHPTVTILDTFLTLDPAAPASLFPATYDIQPTLCNFNDYLLRCQQRSVHSMAYDKLGYTLRPHTLFSMK